MPAASKGGTGLALQSQAKSMSQQYLNSNPGNKAPGGKSTIYGMEDVTAIKELGSFFGKQANDTYDKRYQQQLEDGRYNQQQSATNQLQNDRTAFERQRILNQDAITGNNSRVGSSGSIMGGSSGGGMNTGRETLGAGSTPGGAAMRWDGSSSANKVYDAGKLSEWEEYQRNPAVESTRLFSEAGVAGQMKLNNQQSMLSSQEKARQQIYDVDMMNRQASSNHQAQANNANLQRAAVQQAQNFQAGQTAAERATQERQAAENRKSAERIAGLDAQSRVYSSMYNSFSGFNNNQNYQYWGR